MSCTYFIFFKQTSISIFISCIKFHFCSPIVLFFFKQISLSIFTSCIKFHFCIVIIFFKQISIYKLLLFISYIKFLLFIVFVSSEKISIFISLVNGKNMFNDMINIKDFDSSLLKLDKKSSKNIAIYYISYIKEKMIIRLIVQILFIYLFRI